jgi:hypothetical protein
MGRIICVHSCMRVLMHVCVHACVCVGVMGKGEVARMMHLTGKKQWDVAHGAGLGCSTENQQEDGTLRCRWLLRTCTLF